MSDEFKKIEPEHVEYSTPFGPLSFTKLGVSPNTIILPAFLLGDFKELGMILRDVRKCLSSAKTKDALPEHVQDLAGAVDILASSLETWTLNGNPREKQIAFQALFVGALYERLALSVHERHADAGKRSHEASKKPRKAPGGSLRDYFDSSVPEWRNKTRNQLFDLAKRHFSDRTPASLHRQIASLKKPDGKP